jgi:hypothetical protein
VANQPDRLYRPPPNSFVTAGRRGVRSIGFSRGGQGRRMPVAARGAAEEGAGDSLARPRSSDRIGSDHGPAGWGRGRFLTLHRVRFY